MYLYVDEFQGENVVQPTLAEMDLDTMVNAGKAITNPPEPFVAQDGNTYNRLFGRIYPYGQNATDISGYHDAFDIAPFIEISEVSAGVFAPTGTFAEIQLGEKPDDWDDLAGFAYYTRGSTTGLGGEMVAYALADKTWSALTQYYKCTDNAHKYYTMGGAWFGAGSYAYLIGAQLSIQSLAFSGALSGANSAYLNGVNSYWAFCDTDGTSILTNAPYLNENFYVGGVSAIGSFVAGKPGYRVILARVQYQGDTYICAVCIKIDANGDIYGGFSDEFLWGVSESFFAGEPGPPPPPDPGDWGEDSVNHNPDPGTAHFSDWNALTAIPNDLLNAQWGETNGGGIRAYVIDDSTYGWVLSALWDNSFITQLVHLGAQPGLGVVGVHRLPGLIPSGGSATLRAGGIPLEYNNLTKSAALLTSRIYEIDCGSVTIPQLSGTFADYAASVEMYIPFCGMFTLDTKKIMRGTVSLVYRIDALTGDCVACVSVANAYPSTYNFPAGNSVLFTAQGNCATDVPYGYTDGGAATKLQALSGALTAAISAAAGNPMGLIGAAASVFTLGQQNMSVGGVTGNPASFGHLMPYIWVKYPHMVNPAQYTDIIGRKSGTGGTVGEIVGVGETSGLQIFAAVDVNEIECTDAEAVEIEQLLLSGVYI